MRVESAPSGGFDAGLKDQSMLVRCGNLEWNVKTGSFGINLTTISEDIPYLDLATRMALHNMTAAVLGRLVGGIHEDTVYVQQYILYEVESSLGFPRAISLIAVDTTSRQKRLSRPNVRSGCASQRIVNAPHAHAPHRRQIHNITVE